MKKLSRINDILYKSIMYTVSAVLCVMIAVAFIEVMRRYLWGKTFIWSDDLVRYLIIYVGFIGGAAAYKDNNLASLDLLTSRFAEKVQIVIEIIINTVVTAIIVFLLVYSIKCVRAPSIRLAVGIGLKIKMWIPYLPLPIGFASMILFSAEKYIDMFCRLKKTKGEAE